MPDTERRQKDFFLSYAHRDDRPIDDDPEGWVTKFERALENRLGQVLGRDAEIWWDQKKASMPGNSVLVAAISTGVSSSAILIPILSPSYKASDWCMEELEEFCRVAEEAGGVQIRDRSRIFKIVKTQIPVEKHPPQLQEVIGYQFFRLDPKSGRFRELSLSTHRKDYLLKIDDVAQDIQSFLEELDELGPSPTAVEDGAPAESAREPAKLGGAVPAPEAAAAPTKPAVYLAETTPDLVAERDKVVRTLRQWGHRVLPDKDLPSSGPALRQEVAEYLEQVELSVHLVGENRGSIPDEETDSQNMIQNDVAADYASRKGLRRLIWIPQTALEALGLGNLEAVMGSDLETETDESLSDAARAVRTAQREFVKRLLTESTAHGNVELLHDSVEKLETRIEDRLTPKKKAKVEAVSKSGGDLKYVYLICDRRDEEAAESFKKDLMESDPELEVFLPLFTTEGTDLQEWDVRTFHKESLQTCDGVVIFFGLAKEPWLKAKLGDLRKARGYARERPLKAKAILLAPPAGPRKTPERIRTREAEVVDSSERLSVEALSGFLAKLGEEESEDV